GGTQLVGTIPPTGGAFTARSEMSGNGARTTGTLFTMGHQMVLGVARGDASMRILRGGAGITAQAGFALPTETGSLSTALPSSASVSRDDPIRDRRKQKCRVPAAAQRAWRCPYRAPSPPRHARGVPPARS